MTSLLVEDVMAGPFLENPILTHASTPKELVDIEALPWELFTGILKATGDEIPDSELRPRIQAAMQAEEEERGLVETGVKLPTLIDLTSRMLGISTFTDEEWAEYDRKYAP